MPDPYIEPGYIEPGYIDEDAPRAIKVFKARTLAGRVVRNRTRSARRETVRTRIAGGGSETA